MIRNTMSTALAATLIAATALASLSSCSQDPIQEELIQYGDGITLSPFDQEDAPTLRGTQESVEGQVDESDIDLAPPIDDLPYKFYQNDDHEHMDRPDGWEDPNQQQEEDVKQLTI